MAYSTAKFKIETSPSSDGGYDATESTTIEVQLEASPATDVATCTYSVPILNAGAPTPTLSNSGIADPPTAAVQITLGAGAHSGIIKCQTNGGEAVPGVDGKPDRTVNTFYRAFAVRTTATGLRFLVVGETLQYDTIEGWVAAINEMVLAIENISTGQTPIVHAPAAITASGSYALDFASSGSKVDVTLSNDIMFANPSGVAKGVRYLVKVINGAGPYTAAWGTSWKFGGVSSALTASAGAIDIFEFEGDSGGILRLLNASKGVHA